MVETHGKKRWLSIQLYMATCMYVLYRDGEIAVKLVIVDISK